MRRDLREHRVTIGRQAASPCLFVRLVWLLLVAAASFLQPISDNRSSQCDDVQIR